MRSNPNTRGEAQYPPVLALNAQVHTLHFTALHAASDQYPPARVLHNAGSHVIAKPSNASGARLQSKAIGAHAQRVRNTLQAQVPTSYHTTGNMVPDQYSPVPIVPNSGSHFITKPMQTEGPPAKQAWPSALAVEIATHGGHTQYPPETALQVQVHTSQYTS